MYLSGASDGTKQFTLGGYITTDLDVIDYVTISTPQNAIDFGNLTLARYGLAGTQGF